jgi:hypothetical protein
LLEQAAVYMTARRWGKVLDSGWLRWDLEVYCNSCLLLMVTTAEEEHGGESDGGFFHGGHRAHVADTHAGAICD